jgi:glycosyltransferase involved in cell wall biosynthesis
MKIVFITRRAFPQMGGVERHIEQIAKCLRSTANKVTIISEADIKYPHFKFIGLIYIWYWLFKNRKLLINSDIIHIHDVFIWYLPFRFLYPNKKVFLTIHGLEWGNPFNKWSLFQKRLAVKLSNGSIGVGKFLEKYIGCKFDYIIYGGIEKTQKIYTEGGYFNSKIKNSIVFVGRLESDTGLLQFLEYLNANPNSLNPSFVGDGSLRKDCEKFGKVYGFCDPTPFYKKAETVVPSGYLTYLEAKSYGCKIKTFYGNKLKKEYWEEILRLKKFDTWDDVTDVYLKLWKKVTI